MGVYNGESGKDFRVLEKLTVTQKNTQNVECNKPDNIALWIASGASSSMPERSSDNSTGVLL